MQKLIAIEWIKIRKYRAFWIMMGLYAIALLGINGILSNIQGTVSTNTGGNVRLDLFDTPYLWNTSGWLAGFALLLPCFLIIVLSANEFTYKTFRQGIINGLSRKEALFSKWLLLFLLAAGCWLVYFAVTLIISTSSGVEGHFFSGFQYAGFFFLKILLALSVAFIFTLWIKRSGLAIGLFLVYYFLLEGIAGHYLNKLVPSLGGFLPLSSGSMLVPNPFEKYLMIQPADQPAYYWYVLAACGWIVLMILLSIRYIQRADL